MIQYPSSTQHLYTGLQFLVRVALQVEVRSNLEASAFHGYEDSCRVAV